VWGVAGVNDLSRATPDSLLRAKVSVFRPFKVLDREVKAGAKDHERFVRALYEVRISKGYREVKDRRGNRVYETFEDYCQKTIGYTRRRVDQLIQAADFEKSDFSNPTTLVPPESPPIPDGKYRCIVIDPPWPMKKIARDERPTQVSIDYPTMTIDEIRELPIPDLADDAGCHVYLWTTHKQLPNALSLFESWSVRYQCVMTWVKNVGFTPFSWMYSTEHVVFGRVGNLDVERKGLRLDFSAKVREHSRKPDEFYSLVVQATPAPRIEMFARQEREGFTTWGSETDWFQP
jgi:N6-adenosine-specific RNA methylase IME4